MSSHARHYTTLLQSSQRSLCRSETGERKKESARGIMGRGEIRGRCRLSLFPSSTTRSLFFIDYCYFYWNIHREPLRRREEQQHAQ